MVLASVSGTIRRVVPVSRMPVRPSSPRSLPGHGKTGLSVPLLIDVGHSNGGLGVELGLAKASKRNLTTVKTIGKSGNNSKYPQQNCRCPGRPSLAVERHYRKMSEV